MSDELWTLLDRYGILLGDLLMTVSLLAAVYGIIKRNALRSWLARNRFPSIGGNPEHTHWQGIVFTVSRAEVPLWVIHQVQPDRIGLLITQTSQEQSAIIRQAAEQQGITVYIEILNDPDDPAEANRKTKELLQTLRQNGISELAVDITGGKTPMSLGAFMAAEELSSDSIYVTSHYKDGKPDMNTAHIKAISQATT